jgi:hypothetical protein
MKAKFIPLAAALAWASPAFAGFNPIPLTPGSFNADVVVEKTVLGLGNNTTATPEGGTNNTGNAWYEIGYNTNSPSSGLPPHGTTFTNVTDVSNSVVAVHLYQMAPSYTAKNAVLIDTAVTTATLTLITPAAYTNLSFLVTSANGGGTIGYTVHHADATTETGTFVCPDWFNGANPAFVAFGRVVVTSGILDSQTSITNPGNPRLYSRDVPLADTTSPVTSVDFNYTTGAANVHNQIYALSGNTGSGAGWSPIAVIGYNEDCIVEAGAIRRGNTFATTQSMDSNTNILNSWYEQGYYAFPEYAQSGLPAAGSTITNPAATDHVYTLPPSYASNNAIYLNPSNTSVGVRFVTPASYSALSFLNASGNGPVTIGVVIYHADGTSETNSFTSLDWFNGASAVVSCSGRVAVDTKQFNNVPVPFVAGGVPRLFANDITLANTVSAVTNIVLTDTNASGRTAIFAISGSAGNASYTVSLVGNGNYELIANQLDHGSNTLNEVLPLPNTQDGTVLAKWNCSLQDFDPVMPMFTAGSGWSPNTTLVPGEGAFIVLGGGPMTLTFTGTPHVPVLPASLPCGRGVKTLLSCQTSQVGTFENITGLSPIQGSQFLRWNVLLQNFVTNSFSGGAWSPSNPVVNIGEAAMILIPACTTNTCLTLVCATNKTVDPASAWSFDPPIASDACNGTNFTLAILSTVTNGVSPQTVTRTWQATDLCSNSITCSQVVTLQSPSAYTLTLPPGYSLIANQLDHGSNTLNELFPNPTGALNGDQIRKYNCSGTYTVFVAASTSPTGWSDVNSNPVPATTLVPGEGAFYFNNQATNRTITFTGTPHVPVLPLALPCGCGNLNLVSRQTNDVGTFENIIGASPREGAQLFRFTGAAYTTYTFSSAAWGPSVPSVNVGEAVFINQPCVVTCTPPTVTTQPQSQTLCVTRPVTFSVAASGSSPLSYQWQKNGTPISGATGTNYSLANAQFSDSGNTYKVAVTNACGATTSSIATLVVNPCLPVLTCGTNKTVTPGSTWNFDLPIATAGCCGTNPTVIILSTVTNGPCSQFITRTWQATDCCTNSTTCSQTVTVAFLPQIVSVYAPCGDTQVVVAFSNAVAAASALNATNYQVLCGGTPVSINQVALSDDSRIVTLLLAYPLPVPGSCVLSVSGVQDSCSNALPAFQAPLTCTPEPCSYSSAGSEYWLTFPGNYAPDPANPPQPQLFITGQPGTICAVSIPGPPVLFSTSVTIPGTRAVTVTLPPAADLTNFNDVIRTNAVHVVASGKVTVYGLDYVPFTSDGFLGLSTKALGKSYLVMAYQNVFTAVPKLNGVQFAIAAAQDFTTVTIVPSANVGGQPVANVAGHPAGVPFMLTNMMRGQTYQLRDTNDSTADLSGTLVLADKPIAVFGSHQCAAIPDSSVFYCDYLVEQLFPTELWGTNFVTLPLTNRMYGDTFRFMALFDGTHVYTNSGAIPGVLNHGKFFQLQLTNATHISSDQPILVAQYADSSDYDGVTYSDPFMVVLPPTALYGSNYVVQVPTAGFPTNYLNITALTNTAFLGNVKLDTSFVAGTSFSAIPNSSYAGARVPVTTGPHTLNTADGSAFGVIVYGWAEYDGYGYPAGICGLPQSAPATFTGPATNVVVKAGSGCVASVPDLTPQVNNRALALFITQTPTVGTLLGRGDYNLTLTPVDQFGTRHPLTSTLTVAPSDAAGIQCPANIFTNCTAAQGQVVFYQVGLCNPSFTLTCTPPPGNFFPSGTTTVSCVASNGLGTVESCSFTVTVRCLNVARSGSGVVINWVGPAILQTATNLTGRTSDWQDLATATNSFIQPATAGQKFFRLKYPSP